MSLLDRPRYFGTGGSADGWSVLQRDGREWERFYRERWQHDKVVRSTHGVNCTGSCSWKIYVKDGIVAWETQQTDYPTNGPDVPEYEPRGCPRGASFSWYLYSPIRVRYPYVRGVLLEMFREARARDGGDPVEAWASLGHKECVLESFIDLEREISVIGARGVDGATSFFQPFDNTHRHHILDLTVSPADVPERVAADAIDITRSVLEGLDYVGILCVEFFIAREGGLLVNEIAPRPHNSGHLTFDACRTSQFEQQVRAICGFPLGATDLMQPAAMVNLLGDLWGDGEPDWAAALTLPDVKLHLYGKARARPGRKMGHLTVLAPTRELARDRALTARRLLAPEYAVRARL